jgi:serine/threonine protein kinase
MTATVAFPSSRAIRRYDPDDVLTTTRFSRVWLAHDHLTHERVVIKELLETGNERRAIQEGAILSALTECDAPNVVHVPKGEQDPACLVLEFVEGPTLDLWLGSRRDSSIHTVIPIMLDLLTGLEGIHALGIVHRDIKPLNLVWYRSHLTILDFNVAQWNDAPVASAANDLASDMINTSTNAALGTPGYVAPEAILGEACDFRSDLFSAGALMYELLTGDRPFQGNSPFEMAMAAVRSEPPPLALARPDLPQFVSTILGRLMAKNPVDRYQSIDHVRRDLLNLDATLGPSLT